ncbi:MAG: VCBS repeat-containing protein [Flavobacteriales bacterium]|nr:VCBS repeat-containing protein [Flavobacteriales bacterium]
MKAILSIMFIFTCVFCAAQIETLRHYDVNNATYKYPSGYKLLVARFEPEAPGYLNQINVKVENQTANASAEVTVFGHEGGTSFPQLELPLLNWHTLKASKTGEEWLSYVLDQPLKLDNTQFFVVFRNLNNLNIYADNAIREVSCSSGSGGDYYFLFLKNNADAWNVGAKKSLAVDLEMKYEKRSGAPFFKDVTHQLDVDTNTSNTSVSWADIDQDGFADLVTHKSVYQNHEGIRLVDKSNELNFKSCKGAMVVDLNNDGLPDILQFFASGDSAVFFRNKGSFNFEKINISGFKSLPALSSFSAADIDKDGFPDIFVGQLWGTYPEPYPNYLFKNNGDGTFTDISNKLYPDHNGNENFSKRVKCSASDQNTWLSNGNTNKRSRGSAFVDFNNDGNMDLYVTNYFLEPDEFYMNNGDGSFKNIIAEKQIAQNKNGYNHGTGIDFGDIDNDGFFDILLPQFAHPGFTVLYDHRNTTVYKNSGASDFDFTDLNPGNQLINTASGIEFEETYAGGSWGDVNNDGLLDFYITVFYGCRYVKLYLQNPDHTFSLSTYTYGLQNLNTGEDATWVDYDNDGNLDLCSGKSGRIRIFKNTGKNENYLSLRIKAGNMNKMAIGSRVIVYADGEKITRQVSAGRGVRHQAPYDLHYGLGKRSIEKVEVNWPDGTTDYYSGFYPNRSYEIVQGKEVDGLISENTHLEILNNPGNSAKVVFNTKTRGHLEMRVTDTRGKIIKILEDRDLEPGQFTYYTEDLELSSGIYFIQAVFDNHVKTKKWLNLN